MKARSRHATDAARATKRSTVLRIASVGRWGASALAVAGLLALAEPPWDLWPLAGIALAPWLVWVGGARAWSPLLGSAGVGIVFGCASAPWVPAALRSLGASPAEALAGFLLGAVWVKGLPFAAVGVLVYAARHRSAWVRIALTGAAFLGVDWLHSSWRAGIPWALLGHSQVGALGVAQLAAVGGIPLLSGFLAAINQAVALAWERRGSRESLRPLVWLAAAWAAMALVGLPLARGLRSMLAPMSYPSPLVLLIVQPDVPRGERWAENLQASHFAKVVTETERALREPGPLPDVVLWPENFLTAPIDRSPDLAVSLQATVDRLDVPVILGAVRSAIGSDPDLYRSSVLWLAPGRGIVAAIDKTRAFPLLEARPSSWGPRLLGWAFGSAAGGGKKVEEATQAGPLRAGFAVTVVLCYEALFPGIVAERRDPESVAVVNLADDGWIGGKVATRQLAAFASFRAIEQRLALVRVAHAGLSVVVDPFGELLFELPEDAWAHRRIEVRPSPPPGLVEKAALLALPIATGAGVWWALGPWSRRGARLDGSREAAASGGTLHDG